MGRSPCRDCAYHIYLAKDGNKRRKVMKNIAKDNVNFFKWNFPSTTRSFHCRNMNLYFYLIQYQAIGIMKLIETDYPETNSNPYTNAYSALISIFTREKPTSNRQCPQQIYTLFHNDVLNPNEHYFADILLRRIFLIPSIHLFAAAVKFILPKRDVHILPYTWYSTYEDIVHEHAHVSYFDDGITINTRIFLFDYAAVRTELKVILLSYTVLRLYFMGLTGSRITFPAHLYRDRIHEESLDILESFQSHYNNRSLFSLCRSRLFQAAPSYKNLEHYVNLYAHNAVKNSILLREMDILNIAEELNMTTLLLRFSRSAESMIYDEDVACPCCKYLYRSPYMLSPRPYFSSCGFHG